MPFFAKLFRRSMPSVDGAPYHAPLRQVRLPQVPPHPALQAAYEPEPDCFSSQWSSPTPPARLHGVISRQQSHRTAPPA